jgi:phosphatidylserine/phosphatidylglycerophosphate/cardiolipin synthase-like enzyme
MGTIYLRRLSMRKSALALLLSLALASPVLAYQVDVEGGPYFSPRGGVTDAIMAALADAKRSIYVQAYSFTSAPIAEALVDAAKRGVRVEVILDKGQVGKQGNDGGRQYSSARFLANMRQEFSLPLEVYIDSAHAIAHNKVMVIDEQRVITGSFNFTKAAEERNAENLLILSSPELARRYLDNWQRHRAHSPVYQ